MNEAAPAPRATLPARQRLKSRHHFRAVYQRGRRAGGQWLTIVMLMRRPPLRRGELVPGETARVGLSVSKDHGGAVRRNKLKRLLREAFRLEQQHLPPVDLVLIPRVRPEDFPLAELRTELVQLVARAQEQKGEGRRKPRA